MARIRTQVGKQTLIEIRLVEIRIPIFNHPIFLYSDSRFQVTLPKVNS